MSIADYIFKILKSQPIVLMSWGADRFVQMKDDKGLSFYVSGFVYKGKVEIVYNDGSDLFDIKIGEQKYTGIYFDSLVSFLDGKIEKDCSDEGYNRKANDFLKKTILENGE